MQKYTLLIMFLCMLNILPCKGQHVVNSNGTKITVDSNVHVKINGNLQNDNGVTFVNNGKISLGGNLVNNSAFISGHTSYVKLRGALQNIGGSVSPIFNNLIIDGSADKTLSIPSDISDSLIFISNHIIIGNNDLNLLQNAEISGAADNKFVVTNGSGSLVKKGADLFVDFLFPVGDSVGSFKPVVLNNVGVVDTFAVRVDQGILPTTNIDSSCVQYTYFVEESNTGGSNASLKLGWNTIDEGTWFDRNQALIWHYKNNQWDSISGTSGAISNLPLTEWYSSAAGITDFSSIANRFTICGFQVLSSISMQPASQNSCENGTASFSISAIGSGLHYQWQLSTNGGLTWNNILNSGIYSGVNSATLILNNIPFSFNNYQYQCIIVDLLGNSLTSSPASLTVYSQTAPPAVSSPIVLCKNSPSYPLTASGVNLLWYTQSSGGTGAAIAPIPVTSQIDTLTYYVSQTINACESPLDSIIVIVVPLPPTPSIIINGNTTFCQGGSVILSSSTANSYLWSTSDITQSIIVTNSGTYFVDITDTNGCTASSQQVNITALPLPSTPMISINGDTNLCQGDSVILSSSSAHSYLWSTSDTTQSITVIDSGTYFIEVIDSNGCSATSQQLHVNVLPLPLIPTITINGNDLISSIATSYQWFLNGNIIPGATGQTYTPLQNGNYSVEIQDSNGCSAISAPFNFVFGSIGNYMNGHFYSIYPNPSRDIINVELKIEWPQVNGHYDIYNSIGQTIISKPFDNKKFQVDIRSLASGLYFLSLDLNRHDPNDRIIMKFMKE